MKETPILLLTGYLGSGKTTLVNNILTNKKGIKFAVIVNDIGEVNIDADLIQKGGVVGQKDDSLVALQNGCICCSLQFDLVEQLSDLVKSNKYDYIVIEASGICEPEPIARTIASIPNMDEKYSIHGLPKLDCIVTVVDALRMKSEFECGNKLDKNTLEEDDIENLVIQQIEFCNIVLLNKASEVSRDDLNRIKSIINNLQPGVEIIECDYTNVDFENILNTNKFDYYKVAGAAGWIRHIEDNETTGQHVNESTSHHEHEHHHHHHHDGEECHDENCPCHHHHHHGHSHGDEYGISTFVYYRRQSFDTNKFDRYVTSKWPENVIRAKGICYFSDNPDMTYLFEQAGVQKKLTEAGLWFATAPQDEFEELVRQDPSILKDWDEKYGDRMAKIVFIGQHLDTEQICKDLDECLVEIF
ncbi:MAG: GTP-binding protein [Bacteroidales bacterium]|nr:GTP-binding protein [Bacteroidales bacterium]